MSQADMKSSAGSVVESTQRFDDSVRSFRIFYLRVECGAQVFEGTDILSDETCIIKVLKPVSEKKIKREVQTHPFTHSPCRPLHTSTDQGATKHLRRSQYRRAPGCRPRRLAYIP